MARTPGESRIPVFRSSGSTLATSSLPRPTMLVAPCTSAVSPTAPGRVSAATVGQRVCVGGEVTGVLRFFGPTHLDPGGGMWCGVELDTPDGLNDGCVRGVRYFRCRPRYGILAPENKVRMVLPSRLGTNKSIPQPGIKRRVPPDRDEVRGRRENKTSESSSGSSQEEITPPAEDQPSPRQSEVPRQARSATATPTPGTSALPWEWNSSSSSSKRNSSELSQAMPPDDSLVTEIVSPKEMALISPASSEGYSLSARRLTGGMVLPLNPQGSPPSAPPPLSSKQSSFELDDSLGILTPDQMATDFTVTSAGAGSEDEDEQLGSTDLGGLMLEEVPPSPEALVSPSRDTVDMAGLGAADIAELMLEEPLPSPPHDEVEEPSALHEDHSVSEMSSAADMTAKGTASTCSQQQSVSSNSHQAAPSCSFITSVTSITSLDTGYQGDGEWSRPASRADNSPSVPPPPPPGVLAVDVHKLKFDVMTDSDFFSDPGAAGTESDAEHEAAGMTVGDRRARVIDGTLYGTSPANSVAGPLPVAPAHLMTSSAATIEEMDSSGIFSDIERRPDTSETCSIPPSKLADPQPKLSETLDETVTSEVNTTAEILDTTFTVEESVENNESPKSTAGSAPASKEESKIIKKHKMPKRNVTSKIKALIESGPTPKSDENQENRRPKKGGRWDAVMNKIAQNQAEEKARPKTKEVKSRVFANIAQASPQSAKNSPRASVANSRTNISSRPSSARSRRENAVAPKPKPRRSRMRGGESTSSLRVDEEERGSPNSSHCSSISDVSQTPSLHKPAPPRSTKKRAALLDGVARASSPLSDVSTNSAPPQIAARTATNNNNNALLHGRHTNSPSTKSPISGAASVQQRNQRNALLSATPPARRAPGVAHKTPQDKSAAPATAPAPVVTSTPEMKTPLSIRKQAAARISHKTPPLRDHNRVSSSRHPLNSGGDVVVNGKPEVAKAAPAAPPTPAPLPPHLLKELKHASLGCEAMAVLVQYLVHSLDAYSAPRLKNELAAMREEWLRTKLELEEAQAGYRRLQETLSDEVSSHERREEAQRKEHAQLIATLEAAHQEALNTAQTEHQAALQRLQDELHIAHGKHKTHEESLAELTRVLGEERAASARRTEESARREAELGEQLAKVSAELADTKADSRKFLESMHKDKDSKLQATAERCQTLEKEVDSLRVVLEMRHAELQTLRKASAEAQERADQLAVAKIDLSAARSKLEDLQSQLNAKASIERQLKEENKALTDSYLIETQQNRRLSQAQEELQWKLKHTYEVVNKLAVNSSAVNMSSSLHFPISPLLGRRSFTNSMPNGNSSSLNNNSHRLSPSLDDDIPDSPRMKVMAEKSDSVAWVLDMNEPVDAILERVASNQRQRQDRSSPGRSLPKKSASTSCMPIDQRGKLAGRKSRLNRGVSTSTPAPDSRCRSRSVSTDSESLELESKSCSSQPERHENGEVKKDNLMTPTQASQPTSPSTMLSLPFKLQLQPQESAGEAMISEEISDDAQSDCEAQQVVEASSGRSSESSSIVMANTAQLDMEDDDIEEVEVVCKQAPCRLSCPTHPPHRQSPTPDSVSQLGFTDCSTAMDLSWSEDFELFPSESEG